MDLDLFMVLFKQKRNIVLLVLEQLRDEEFKMFKLQLSQLNNVGGFITSLDRDRGHTADMMVHFYDVDLTQVMLKVLQDINRLDLSGLVVDEPIDAFRNCLLRMRRLHTSELPQLVGGLKEKRGAKRSHDRHRIYLRESTPNNEKKRRGNRELKDAPGACTSTIPHDPDASTSTIPHDPDASTSTILQKWHPVSKRWRPQFEKLVNMDDSKVKKVKSLVFGKGKEFRIGEGSNGVEVFLGLRHDGTEVAVKKMSKTHNLYSDLKNDQQKLRDLDDPSIVRYIDFVEDEDYGYLVLQLCESTLEEYITTCPEKRRKPLAKQILNSLRILHCQDGKILHRDIKPQNVLIDIHGKARLADFGISRQIDQGKTTYRTKVAGTPCWMAKETLYKSNAGYKRSTEIQPAGMLMYYVLSGGHHPFLEDTANGPTWKCQQNISEGNYCLKHVEDDVVAKHLVEWMIHGEPKERPSVEQCLAHPIFWPNTWRKEYLRRVGNEKEVEKYRKAEQDENKATDEEERELIRSLKVLIPALDQYAEQGQFNAWKQKFREAEGKTREVFEEMDEHRMKRGPGGQKKKFYSDNSFGLLRFIRNLHAHYAEAAAAINLTEMFPALFGCVYKFAEEQGWNSRSALKEMFGLCPRCAFTSCTRARCAFTSCTRARCAFTSCTREKMSAPALPPDHEPLKDMFHSTTARSRVTTHPAPQP